MAGFRSLPVRRKIVVTIAIASAAALVITTAAGVAFELGTFRPSALAELEAEVEIVRATLAAALSFFDSAAAGEDLASLRARSEIRVAAVYDADGHRFATYLRTPGDGLSFPAAREGPTHEFGSGYLDLWKPISVEGDVVGQLFVRRDLRPLAARLSQYGLMLVAVVVALLTASVLIVTTLGRTILSPILELSEAAQRVRDAGDFSVRVARHGEDEIGKLTDTFNEMLVAIEKRERALGDAVREQQVLHEQLVQAQKLESIGVLAGGVAHDFNNFLTVVAGSVELVQGQLGKPSPVDGLIENIREATDQATELTGQLLAFARKQIIEPRIVDPNRLVDDTHKMLRSVLKEDIDLQINPEPDPWMVRVDPNQMTQVLMNLTTNARDAMPRGGRLVIELRNAHLDQVAAQGFPGLTPGDYVSINVRDTGEGMSDETRRRVFEPFFTTKDPGKGIGLGLAMCYGIVKQNDGHIWVESVPGEGTTFRLYLRRSLDAPAQADAAEPSDPRPGRETILVVEDNDLVRATTVRVLQAYGYSTLEAEGGSEALDLVRKHRGSIDLLITDVVMPAMSGPQVAQRLRLEVPGLRVLYMSGYTADELSHHDVESADIAFLQKPYTSRALTRRVRAILDG